MTGSLRIFSVIPIASCYVFAQDGDQDDFMKLAGQAVACVQQINQQLGTVETREDADRIAPEVEKLVKQYMDITISLKKIEPPGTPEEIAEYTVLQERMKELENEFRVLVVERIKRAEKMTKKLEDALNPVSKQIY